MKNNDLSEFWSSLRLIFIHYINFLYFYPKYRGAIYVMPIFKFIVSSIIFQLAVTSKKIFPNLYNSLKNNKKLKKSVKKLVKFDRSKIQKSNQFYLYIFKKYIDEPKIKKRTIYIDISQYKSVQIKSGIQRVVKKIIQELSKNKKYNGFNISYFYFPQVFPNAYLAEFDINTYKTKRYFFPKENDIIFFLDFDVNSITLNKELIDFLIQKNIKFAAMVYDILPYTNPRWFPVKNYKKIYLEWINIILKLNIVFTISNTVKKKIIKNFTLKKTNHIIPIKLGGDFNKSQKKKIYIKKSKEMKFLMVGTIEPRKGHSEIIKSFNILLDNCSQDVRLDIVGNLGWNYDKTLSLFNNSKYKNKKIFFHHAVNDKALSEFYLKSDAIIIASYDEGFGLPIAEAMHKNKKVIARNIDVFREVGKNKIFYFPKKIKPKQLAKFFINWIKKYGNNKVNYGKMKFTNWTDTTKKIQKELKKI